MKKKDTCSGTSHKLRGSKGIHGCAVQCKCFVTGAWTWQDQHTLLKQWSHKWVTCPERVPWRPLHQAPGHIFLIPYIFYRETILDIFIECLITFIGIVFHFSQLLSQAPAVSWGWMLMPQGKKKIITKALLKPLGMVIRNRFSAQYIIWWSSSHVLHGDKKRYIPLDNDNSQILGGTLSFLTLHRSPGSQLYASFLFWVIGNITRGKNGKKLICLWSSVYFFKKVSLSSLDLIF